MAEAQRLYEEEGLKVPAIHKRTKLNAATLYRRAKQWKAGKRHARATPAPASIDPGANTGVTRRCGKCGAKSAYERCPNGHSLVEG